MRADVLLKHKLVPAGEATDLALEGLVLRWAALVLVQQVLGQELPLLGGEGALGAQLGEVSPAVLFEALRRVEAHLAGAAAQLRVLLLLVLFKSALALAGEVALCACVCPPAPVLPILVELQSCLGAKACLTLAAHMAELPRVAALGMPTEVVLAVTTVVAELAEVRGFPVVHALPMQPQLGRGTEGLAAEVAGMAAQSSVQGLMGIKAVAARGAECAEAAAVWPGSLVFQGNMLGHAALLFAGEGAGLALKMGPFALRGSWRLFLLMDSCMMV